MGNFSKVHEECFSGQKTDFWHCNSETDLFDLGDVREWQHQSVGVPIPESLEAEETVREVQSASPGAHERPVAIDERAPSPALPVWERDLARREVEPGTEPGVLVRDVVRRHTSTLSSYRSSVN